ncbi:MAG: AIM24 family protein, partial [Candidatus Thalassarchaeaceae archaeon]|nr:AIM24 family protein [Candidatus Thalassarchaeaceae archaeon]
MPAYEIVISEELRMVKVALQGDEVRSERGAMHYMRGQIEMVTKMPGVGKLLKSVVSKESIFRPTYKGTGEVYF